MEAVVRSRGIHRLLRIALQGTTALRRQLHGPDDRANKPGPVRMFSAGGEHAEIRRLERSAVRPAVCGDGSGRAAGVRDVARFGDWREHVDERRPGVYAPGSTVQYFAAAGIEPRRLNRLEVAEGHVPHGFGVRLFRDGLRY